MSKDDKAQVYEVAVTGPGIEIKLPVSESLAHRAVALIMGAAFEGDHASPGSAGGGGAGATSNGAHTARQRGRTPRQAIDEAQAKRNFDKITAIGAMLIDSGAESFTIEDLRTQLRRANEALPKNLSRDFGSAVTLGWIASDGDNADAYYVTQAGRVAIAGKFSGDAKKKVRSKKVKNKKI